MEPVKKFFRIAEFVGQEALSSIARSFWMSWLVVLTIAVSLSILGGFWLVVQDLQHVSQQVGSKVPVAVFLSEDAKPADLEAAIREMPEVASVRLIGKEEAWQQMQQDMRTRMTFNTLLDVNPLPNALSVQTRSAEATPLVAERIAKMPYVEDIEYGQDLLRKINEISAFIRTAGLAISGILAAASLAVIVNTIRLAVMARRREIEIMHLVGASNWFIAWPFLLEGMLFGFFGAVLTTGLLVSWRYFTFSKWQELLPFVPMRLDMVATAETLVVLTLLGMSLGAAGSLMSVRKHLKLAMAPE